MVEPNEVVDIASIVFVVVENAIKTADVYRRHAGRMCIANGDLLRALMVECYVEGRRPGMLEECVEMRRLICGDGNGTGDDGTGDDGTGDGGTGDGGTGDDGNGTGDDGNGTGDVTGYDDWRGEFTASTCTCPVCNCMNGATARWGDFAPTGAVEEAISDHIGLFGDF
jgi:hypothetical protein